MKKSSLMLAALFAGLGVQAQAGIFGQAAGMTIVAKETDPAPMPKPGPKPKPGTSWTRVQVKLGKAARKPAVINVAKPPRRPPPTCGVRG